MNILCPGDDFFQIALDQEIRNPIEWLLYEFQTFSNDFEHFFEYSKILMVKKKEIWILLIIDLIFFYSTFDLKACSNDRKFRGLLCRWLLIIRIYNYCKSLRREKVARQSFAQQHNRNLSKSLK